MSSLDSIVNVQITPESSSVAQAGFGVPLILGTAEPFVTSEDLIRSYDSLESVAVDFSSGDPEYLAAAAIFSQQPKINRICIGRRTHLPTMQVTLTAPATLQPKQYSVTLNGVTFNATPAAGALADPGALMTALAGTINAGSCGVFASATGSALTLKASKNTVSATFTASAADKKVPAGTVFTTVAGAKGPAFMATADILLGTDAGSGKYKGTGTLRSVKAGNISIAENTLVVPTDIAALTGFTMTNTASVAGSTPVEGAWFSVETDPALLGIAYDNAEPGDGAGGSGIEADLNAIKHDDDSWYVVLSTFQSKAEILAISKWAETNAKLFIANSSDSAIATSSTSDVASQLKELSRARTALMYHPNNRQMAAAAWAGKLLPYDAGTENWKFKTLSGVTPLSLTNDQLSKIKGKFANYYITVAGISITGEGTVSAKGEYIDTIRGTDALRARIQETIFAALASARKVPYTDAGIALVESILKARLKEGVDIGFLSDDPAPSVSVPKASDPAIQTARSNRLLPNVNFTAHIAGAINELTIRGVLAV